MHKALARVIAKFLRHSKKGPAHRARVNFALCFPDKSFEEREQLIEQTLYTATLFTLRFSLLSLRSQKWLAKQCDFSGLEHLQQQRDAGNNVILLTGHSWAIDITPVLFASMGLPMTGFVKQQKNPVTDWLMHRQRLQYGGKVFERSVGIKPYVKAIRDGWVGYYLPDQDHGRDSSEFTAFFAAQKATLSGLGKMAKLGKATILPAFTKLNCETGRYEITLLAPITPSGDGAQDAQLVASTIEQFVAQAPEQYMWVLRLLNTQPDGRNYYRLFRDRYQSDWTIK